MNKTLAWGFVVLLSIALALGGLTAGIIQTQSIYVDYLYSNNAQVEVETSLDLNENSISDILQLQFNLTECDTSVHTVGKICYDPDEDTLSFFSSNGQIIQLGRELGEQGINREGSTLSDGSVVSLSGASGNNPEFIAADATNLSKSAMLGVLTTSCINGGLCPVTAFGFVNTINTSAWNVGDKLYINATHSGKLTNIKPTLPNNPKWVATVVRKNAINGRIFVYPTNDPTNGFLTTDLQVLGNTTLNNLVVNSLLFNDTVFDDLQFGVNNLRINPISSKPDEDSTNIFYLFDDTDTETIRGSGQTSHSMKNNTPLYCHVHWMQSATGNVTWQLNYTIVQPNILDTSWTIINASTGAFTYSSGSLHQITGFTATNNVTGLSNIIRFKLSRLGGATTDTMTGDAQFMSFDCHYQIDRVGSNEEYSNE